MRRRSPGRGQALVEFALVAPIFIFILLSLIEFGRAVYTMQMLNNAAREGARYAIVHGAEAGCPSGPMPVGYGANPCDPQGANVVRATKDYAIAIIDAVPNAFTVSVHWCADDGDISACPGTLGDGDNGRNETVQISLGYTYKPIIANVFPFPSFTLNGGSTLVINH